MGYAKWIGAFMGLMNGGPIGALAGFVIGSIADKAIGNGKISLNRQPPGTGPESESTRQEGERNGFLFSLMVLTYDIMQADGKIMHSEMETMRAFLRNNFGEDAVSQGEDIIRKLNEKRKQMGDAWWRKQIQDCCRQMSSVLTYEQRLQLVSYLIDLAKADGKTDTSEINAIKADARTMGVSDSDVDQMMGLGGKTLEDAYRVLGVSPDATDDEVRKAYRTLALKHHPDRVQALGEDVRLAAEKKFQEINDAKERVWKARGMK